MKFVTITNHRSGSSFFQRCLNSHPKIKARQEDLRDIDQYPQEVLEKRLNSIFEQEKNFEAVGFKLMYRHILPWVKEYLEKNGVKKIQLIRRDILETAIFYPTHFIGDVEGGMGPPLKIKGSVKAKIDEVISTMKDINRWIDEWRLLADFTVYYDDICSKETGSRFKDKKVRKDLLTFLGVEDMNLADIETGQTKNERLPAGEVLENYDELVAEVKRQGIRRYYVEK